MLCLCLSRRIRALTRRKIKIQMFNIFLRICFLFCLKLRNVAKFYFLKKFSKKFTVLRGPFKFKKSFEYFGFSYFCGVFSQNFCFVYKKKVLSFCELLRDTLLRKIITAGPVRLQIKNF